MNQSKSFGRKVLYIAIIGGLLIPLSLVSRPATRDKQNAVSDPGGVLSSLRDKHELSQALLSEIDPGSETMKLASLGLRGIAVNVLWMKAMDAKDKKQWDTFSSTLNSLVKIQPNFIKVWEFQGHNLSYNTAVEFDDYEQRYRWIKKGIEFLTTGIRYNRRDHRIIDTLGFFCGNKFGTADERIQYRSLFRNDTTFHDEMSKFVDIKNINTPYGPDHWLLAYEWYDRSITMVEVGIDETGPVERRRKEMLFYNYKPAQLRNMGLSLQSEFRADEYTVELWNRAHKEWLDFGNRSLNVFNEVETTMESMISASAKIQNLRSRLDALVPGQRNRILAERLARFTDEERLLLNQPVDSLTDEQFEQVQRLNGALYGADIGVDQQISQMVPSDKQTELGEIMRPLVEEAMKVRLGTYFRTTVNYEHWKLQSQVEGSPKGIAARQAEFDAIELRDQSIFDEYELRDPVTGEAQTLPGSIQKFDESFALWAEIVDEYPQLTFGPLMDDVTFNMVDYRIVREVAGEDDWPRDFVLQDIVDKRAEQPQTADELPVSADFDEDSDTRMKVVRYRIPPRPNIEFTIDPNWGEEKEEAEEEDAEEKKDDEAGEG